MNAKQFSFALGKVDDKYIMESAAYERKKETGWQKWGMMAACFCLLSIAAVMLPGVLKGTGGILPPSGPVVAGPVTSDNDQQSGTDTAQSPQVIIEWENVAVNESDGMVSDAAPRYYDPDTRLRLCRRMNGCASPIPTRPSSPTKPLTGCRNF